MDTIQNLIAFLIFTLIFTGGFQGKIEFSQVDIFGWLFLVTVILRTKIKGAPFSDSIQRVIGKTIDVIEIRPAKTLQVSLITIGLVFVVLQTLKYQSFDSTAFDLSYLEHGIWAFAKHGFSQKFLYSTISRSGSYLSEHFSPLLIALSPLYLLSDSIIMMFVGQSLLMILSAVLLYRYARLKLETKHAVFVTFLFLLYQPVRAVWGFDFREDIFFLPLIFGMLISAEKKNILLFSILALLMLGVKENGGILLCLIGLILLQKNKLLSLVSMTIGLLGFLIINFKIMPALTVTTNDTVMMSRLGILGFDQSHPVQSILSNFTNIVSGIIKVKISPKTAKYLFLILLPFSLSIWFGFRKSKMILVSIAALLSMNILISPQTLGFHYECLLVPFLFLLLIENYNETKTKLAPIFCMFLCTFGRSPILEITKHIPNKEQRCLSRVLAAVPSNLSITTQTALHPHLLKRLAIQNLGDVRDIKGDFIFLTQSSFVNTYASNTVHEVFEKDVELGLTKIFSSNLLTVWSKKEVDPKSVVDLLKEQPCLTQ